MLILSSSALTGLATYWLIAITGNQDNFSDTVCFSNRIVFVGECVFGYCCLVKDVLLMIVWYWGFVEVGGFYGLDNYSVAINKFDVDSDHNHCPAGAPTGNLGNMWESERLAFLFCYLSEQKVRGWSFNPKSMHIMLLHLL